MRYARFCPACLKTWEVLPVAEAMRALRAKPRCECGAGDIFIVRVDSAGRRRHTTAVWTESELAPT